ncbi:dihydrodipicolinate reductase [Magnetococcus marinus MC-1]|uniref:4-hydroxy-tetrahydrodipicolinate reductase n=1 Tax=Magnetococcus marinus (strain ATCC BAA-1437 / JCM 17883 / MC-1) TaxID=156889 RepID=DAPB_MAGMM|nr:4-hydroxy-tetrahydrodipicolinate reductase [Magnetococcus marinus]A0L4Z4.1 RecName: Full=4-hydroxy-tetrahydrodipicolinate reductase; Short=HTPA reductase [Magnetococcus marinus MC-1]ABK43037.1 dihydrodipicolinate reductase [Magnetococcus marinus MC-1]
MTIKVGVTGVCGRMGRMLVEATHKAQGCMLGAASEYPGHTLIGADAGELAGVGKLGVLVGGDAETTFRDADVVIDFSVVEATLAHLRLALAQGTPIVIGTTGFSAAERQQIALAAERIPVVFAPNYAVGVNLLFKIAAEVAAVLGGEYDIEIVEAHHRHKVDAPSGTALGLGQAIAEAVERNLDEVAIYGRQGQTGARDPQTIGFSTIRGGDVVGDHTAMFMTDGERLELTHRASSRMTFAKGAVRAAKWVVEQKPGLYDMRDILGFK